MLVAFTLVTNAVVLLLYSFFYSFTATGRIADRNHPR